MTAKSRTLHQSEASSDDQDEGFARQRRHFLEVAAGCTAAVGISATAYPFLESLLPSARARAEGGPVAVDLTRIEPGEQTTVVWRGRPVWVLHRTPEEIDELSSADLRSRLRDPNSDDSEQPEYAHNAVRSQRPEYFVCVANCTHLGCVPLLLGNNDDRAMPGDPPVEYICPCHGSRFDLAGRVFKGVPAPRNLVVPPYHFVGDDKLVIGTGAAAPPAPA